jgi:hypothetical protein
MDGKAGEATPQKLAGGFVRLAGMKEPTALFAAGADAVQTFEAKANMLLAQANAYRELSSSLAHEDSSLVIGCGRVIQLLNQRSCDRTLGARSLIPYE